MKKNLLAMAALAVLCVGCESANITTPHGYRIKESSFLYKLDIGKLATTNSGTGTNSTASFELTSYHGDGVAAIQAIIEAAVTAAVKGTKAVTAPGVP